MMLANDLKTYYDEVRRYLDCPKDEQDRLLLSVNKQVIELQVDNPNLDYDGIVEFLGEPESLTASLMERLSPDVVQKFKKKKRRLRLSIIACVAVVVVALSTLVIYTIHQLFSLVSKLVRKTLSLLTKTMFLLT